MKKIIIFCNLTFSLHAGQYATPLTPRQQKSASFFLGQITKTPQVYNNTNNVKEREKGSLLIGKITKSDLPDSVKEWLLALLDAKLTDRQIDQLPERFFPI